MTKRRDLVALLLRAGFKEEHGGSHDKFKHANGREVTVPRHREIKNGMARIILRQAGIRKWE